MGSYDGAEICELIGLLILNNLSNLVAKNDVGLYRDDGLIVVRNKRGRSTDKLRKEIVQSFKSIDLQIEIVTGLPSVDFLDVTLNLKNDTFKPFKKPNDSLLYVHASSNHPPQVLKQLPTSIAERLSNNSSNQTVFNSSKTCYEEALKKSGYPDTELKYSKRTTPKEKRNRHRNVIWFNPPFSKNVSTNVARKFLALINKHFSKRIHLKKLFNKNNIKVSYSCTENIGTFIKKHNAKISSQTREDTPSCNCRIKNECPLNGDCQKSSVIYKCIISVPNFPTKVYIGLTEKKFKVRWNSHKLSLANEKYKNSTSLSSYVWDLKEKNNVTPTLKWSIIKHAKSYTSNARNCSLCLQEKFEILFYPSKEELLNKRSELITKCRHMNKFMLANYKSKD